MLPSHGLNALVLPLQRYTKEHFLEQQGKAILESVAAHINQAASSSSELTNHRSSTEGASISQLKPDRKGTNG